MSEISDVIVAAEAAKLPPSYADLADPQKPLPAGVAHFEKRVTAQQILKAVVIALVLAVIGVIAVIFGVAVLFSNTGVQSHSGADFYPLGFGCVCLFGAWMMVGSLRLRRDLMRRQEKGEPTRLGVLLTPDAIFEVGEFGYCIVPRVHFRGISGDDVRYAFKGQDKSFRLPDALVSGDVQSMKATIDQWAKAPVQ